MTQDERTAEQQAGTWRKVKSPRSKGWLIVERGVVDETIAIVSFERDADRIVAGHALQSEVAQLRAVVEEIMPDGVTIRGDTFDAEGWLNRAHAALKASSQPPAAENDKE